MCPTCERAGRDQPLMTGGGTHHLLLGGVSVAGCSAPSRKYSMPHQLQAAACRSARHTPERYAAAAGVCARKTDPVFRDFMVVIGMTAVNERQLLYPSLQDLQECCSEKLHKGLKQLFFRRLNLTRS